MTTPGNGKYFNMRALFAYCFCCLVLYGSLYAQSEKGILKGFVFDKKTDLKLSNASIIISNTGQGISTDTKGYFEIILPAGTYQVEARILGYVPLIKNCVIRSDEASSLFFELEPEPVRLGEVSIVGNLEKGLSSGRGYKLLPGELKNIPQFGESDPLRALFALPGVNTLNNLSNQLFVLGGNFDETLVSLNNVPMHNQSHLGGIFSGINSDIISNEKLYLSNYPQSLGGYLSGALELSTKSGNSDELRAKASIGLISSKLYLEGPLPAGTFIASARRTYFDAIAKIFHQSLPYFFYDGYFKYSLSIDKRNHFETSAFYSKDVLPLEFHGNYRGKPFEPRWGNLLLNSKWTYSPDDVNIISMNAFLSSSFSKSDEIKEAAEFNNNIDDKTISLEFNNDPGGNPVNAGIEFKHLTINYFWNIGYSDLRNYINTPEEVFFDYAPNPFAMKSEENIISAFTTFDYRLSEKMFLQGGLRGAYLGSMKHLFPSVSLGIDYELFNNFTLNFSYGRYYQYLYTIKEKRSESIYTPFTVYFISTNPDNVSFSDNYLVSFANKKLPYDIEFILRGYYKNRHNLASSYNDFPRYRFEGGYSTGIDVMLKRDKGLVTGWLGYSFGKSVKRNDQFTYYSNYDRRHTIKLLLGYQVFEKWRLSAFWTYSTGTPYTDIIGKYFGGHDLRSEYSRDPYFMDGNEELAWRAIDGTKNTSRIEDNHRLDVGLTGSFIWGKIFVKPYLQVLNAYNSPNDIILNNHLRIGEEETLKYPSSFVLPTIGVEVEF